MTTDEQLKKEIEILNKDLKPEGPHGWIQWKGTSVCMDVHCSCGELTHIDAEFCYYIECGNCKKKYLVGANIKLYPLTEEEIKFLLSQPYHHDFHLTQL